MSAEPINSKREAILRNRAAGFYFFERDTMRFFNSRISESFYTCEARRTSYFVSSERNTRFTFSGRVYQRKYTVRAIDWDSGDVRTIGEFNACDSMGVAQRKARAYSDGAAEPSNAAEAA